MRGQEWPSPDSDPCAHSTQAAAPVLQAGASSVWEWVLRSFGTMSPSCLAEGGAELLSSQLPGASLLGSLCLSFILCEEARLVNANSAGSP